VATYRNNNHAINGIGGHGAGSTTSQGIYEESSTPKHAIGEKIELSDGRVFRYGYTAAAINAGLLVSQDISSTSLAETDDIIIASAGRFSISAGSSAIQITLASISANDYAGALLQITDDAGEGMQYRVKSNSATGATTSGKVDIDLYDPLKVAVTTSSDIAIVGNLWYNVLGATAATDYIISGVTPIAFSANYYGWLQTAGIATILADGSIAISNNLTLSDGVAGAVQLKDAETEPQVGLACYAPDNTGHVGVVLQGLVV
jgi:hypothetical protein